MDNLPPSIFPPSPPSFLYHAGHPVIEFASCEVPEQWLLELDDVVVAKNEGYDDVDDLWPVGSSLSPDSALSEQPLPPQPPPPPQQQQQQQELSIQQLSVTAPAQQRPGTKRRGRKPGPCPYSPTVSHVDDLWPVGCSLFPDSALSEQPLPPQPPPPQQQQQQQELSVTAPAQQRPGTKRRGRKPGPCPYSPTVSHVETERQRREKLNRRFCDLRAAVPTVSRMDRASLLSDATAYIAELRACIARLEAESRQAAEVRWEPIAAASCGAHEGPPGAGADEVVEVRMLGPDAAAVRATSVAPHAPARLMSALRSLELHVQHACVSRVNGMTVQDVVIDVATPLQDDDDGLRAALLQMMQDTARATYLPS